MGRWDEFVVQHAHWVVEKNMRYNMHIARTGKDAACSPDVNPKAVAWSPKKQLRRTVPTRKHLNKWDAREQL